jgi:Zn-dependent peptidase ImmA (M78 family)
MASVPINPDLLQWAIGESGYSAGELVERLKIERSMLTKWLEGDEQPSKTQFNRLVSVLGRPSSLFFLPEPPTRSEIPEEYRSAPGRTGRNLRPSELRDVRSKRRLQRMLSSLLQEEGYPGPEIPRVTGASNPEVVAETARRSIGVTIEQQLSWDSDRQAFVEWRDAFRSSGIVVLQSQLGPDGIRGYSLGDDFAPMIVVNTAYNYAARVFSVAHEFGHLVRGRFTACVDMKYGSSEIASSSSLERWCESFAAAYLMPASVVQAVAESPVGGRFELAEHLAAALNVSIRAAALRLAELDLVDADGFYREVNQRAVIWDRDKGFARGRAQNRVERRLSEMGSGVLAPFLAAYDEGRVNELDIRRYLGIGGSDFQELRDRVRESAA